MPNYRHYFFLMNQENSLKTMAMMVKNLCKENSPETLLLFYSYSCPPLFSSHSLVNMVDKDHLPLPQNSTAFVLMNPLYRNPETLSQTQSQAVQPIIQNHAPVKPC